MSTIKFTIKSFNELSLLELYGVLQLRSHVFIVEQNCVYQDIDGKDEKALHVLGIFEDKIVGYCRLFKSNDYFKNASIGRVIMHPEVRAKKWGNLLMDTAINAVKIKFNESKITISAQLYLQKFYESHGFYIVGDSYLEDDIPHIEMLADNL